MKWLSAGLVFCVACTTPPAAVCDARALPVSSIGDVNQPLQVTIGIETGCNMRPPDASVFAADQVEVELIDPDGNPFSFTPGSLTNEADGLSMKSSVRVDFTPNQPGVWRLTARFEPSIGSTTQLISVLEFRADAGSRTIAAEVLPNDCYRYAQTTLGTVVCAASAGTVIGTSANQQFSAFAAAIQGTTLWLLKTSPTGAVERWAERDGGIFEKTHEGAFDVSSSSTLAAAPDESVWFSKLNQNSGDGEILHLFPDADGGLRSRLHEVGRVFPVGLVGGNEAAFVVGDVQLVQVNDIDGGQNVLPRSFRGEPQLRGADGTTLWTMVPDSGVLESWTQAANGAVVRAMLAIPEVSLGRLRKGPLLAPMVPLLPVGSATGAVPELVDGQIVLRGYRASDGFTVVAATKEHIYARRNDNAQLQVIDR